MHVIKRDGRQERVMFDKITSRIQKLCYGLNMDFVDPAQITMKVIQGLYSGADDLSIDRIVGLLGYQQLCLDVPARTGSHDLQYCFYTV
ncbi:ribonucleotide reductase M1, isoform CRA_a [Mus musculus]|nr:ribonucleotide reductase M1, isoform CRA_a [Mus musculus]